MSYSAKTRFFKIPYMGTGDYMTQENNKEQMDKIDSMLYVATGGISNCFLSEGEYSVGKNDPNDETFSLSISVNESGFSLYGILAGRPFYSNNTLTVGGLNDNSTYDIYVEPSNSRLDGLLENPMEFILKKHRVGQAINSETPRLLACRIEIQDGRCTFADVEKINCGNLLSHVAKNKNPHGNTLHQDNLVVENTLTVAGLPVYGAMYDSFSSPGTGSQYEYSIPAGKQVVFVDAYPENSSAGQIAWRIDSEENKIVFSNSGTQGVLIKIKIEFRNA